ncbi:MAG: twitching motility protein PilT [Eubacteriales bacterium]|nr:twitching motility protein PilT [Eubacteriales bacterium]
MVQLIVGEKGKGKTKYILDKVNAAVKEANGSIVYLDKSTKHMYELNNKIRLVDVSAFPLTDSHEFVGFICGIISQNRDIEAVYLDAFLKLAKLEGDVEKITECINRLAVVSDTFKVDFVISMSISPDALDESIKDKVEIAL